MLDVFFCQYSKFLKDLTALSPWAPGPLKNQLIFQKYLD